MDHSLKVLPDRDMYLFRAFSPDGWLSKVIPDYRMREGQLRLAKRIDHSFREGSDLVAEGPVGIGKTAAYCVPLAYHASKMGNGNALIVTANIALQEQLVLKDLPLLKKALPWEFNFTLIKGRNNYLCRDRLTDLYEKGPNGITRLQVLDAQENTNQHLLIAAWANRTDTGDRSELTFEPTPKVWSRFSVTSEECLGAKCPQHSACYANKARDYTRLPRASGGHIYVTNYHLFFGSMSRERVTDLGHLSMSSLPEYDYLVMDEADRAADVAREFFGFKVNEGSLRWVSSRITDKPALRRELENASTRLFQDLRTFAHSREYNVRLRDALLPDVYQTVFSALLSAELYFQGRVAWHTDLKDRAKDGETKQKLGRMVAVAEHAGKAAHNLANRIQQALRVSGNEFVYSLEEDKDHHLTIRAKRLCLNQDDVPCLNVSSRVLVSATLTVGGSFDHVIDGLKRTVPEIGIHAARPFVAESPFHWVTQAKLVVPEDLPSPKDKEFQKHTALAMGYIIQQAKGRTMLLFTSWRALEATYTALKGKVAYRLLKQGEMPRTKLIEEFKRDTSSVLLGVESFWSGIDVPGEALSCVVIDKLPFPNPDDPVMDALESASNAAGWEGQGLGDTFRKYSIPRMILSLRQGFGRLIRSTQDRGVVVILDKRVHTQWDLYGRMLVNSLPPVALSTDLDDVGRFLKG